MQLSHTKTSMSFSAMLFGPFYFFYRKAWKPAFAFLAAELVLALPTFIDLLQVTDSSLAPGLPPPPCSPFPGSARCSAFC